MVFSYLKKWIDVWDYIALDPSEKQITFYSEGKNYWPYLKDIIIELLTITNVPIYYITSDKEDPGLHYRNSNLKKILIDEGSVRNWLFKKLNTKILIMTMPDLDTYQIKKSNKTSYYIHIYHALTGIRKFRKGGLDSFDIVFCPGPHNVDEIRILEKYYDLPKKEIVKTGYPKIDMLLEKYENYISQNKEQKKSNLILVAPTWGDDWGMIELGKGKIVIESLINQGYKVVLRPHPETFKHSLSKITEIENTYRNDRRFTIEKNVSRDLTLFESAALVTDWSGIAWEYALALKKPILFLDTPQRINNPELHKLPADSIYNIYTSKYDLGNNMESFEVIMRSKCGVIWDGTSDIIDLIDNQFNASLDVSNYVYNVKNSAKVSAEFIKNLAYAQ